MNDVQPSPLAQHIEVTNDDVVVDGQSIGAWIKRGGVIINAQGINELPQITVTLMASRMSVNLDTDEQFSS